nr:hypothetical protein [Tanacetum cinerariifolium]
QLGNELVHELARQLAALFGQAVGDAANLSERYWVGERHAGAPAAEAAGVDAKNADSRGGAPVIFLGKGRENGGHGRVLKRAADL